MKKVMVFLGVTLVSGLILTTAQDIQAQETSGNIVSLRSRRGGSRSSNRGSRSGSKSGFGSVKDIILIVIQEKALSLIVGPVRATSQVVAMIITLVLVDRIVRVRTVILALNQIAVRAIQKASLLLVTVLASQNRIQIQATQSLRCLPLS